MGLGVLSHQAGHSAGLSSWAFGMPMARKCREGGWFRLFAEGSQDFLDVVVKVEWHAWRSSWACGLHAVSKCALAAGGVAAKTEQKHCTVATGNGAGAVEEAIECAHGTAEGAAADGDGAAYEAAYEAAYQYSVNHLEDPIRRFNGEGGGLLLDDAGPRRLPPGQVVE